MPGTVIAIQTFGDFLGFNPHSHVLVTDGCFYGKGMFRVTLSLDLKKLKGIFRHRVFQMLLAKGRITKDLIAMLSNWYHSGFQVFWGNRKHLGLWLVKSRPTPKAHAPPAGYLRDPFPQLPMNDDLLYRDPDYAWDPNIQS